MIYTFNGNNYAMSKSGIIVNLPDQFDLKEDFKNPKTWPAIKENGDRVRVKVDHDATGTDTTGTGDTSVVIC